MFFSTVLAGLAVAATTVAAQECTTQRRIDTSDQVAIAYNAEGFGASAEAFKLVPWGSPDSAGTCLTTIIPNGLGCAIPVATTGAGTYQFAVETRQVFNQLNVTEIVPFNNGTVLLSVEIHIGAREFVPIPVTFHGYVYMDYNTDCRIYSARAYADVPTSVLNMMIPGGTPGLPAPGLLPLCKNLPIGGQKKREISFEA
ncbi:hypothetical protein CLAFUW4_09584 [Fulvia fulva]|uniref:Uncharacterized protein n=1 Tax=Passalora fulva TaxID=5499 RepID=A0A9Q8UTB7_PASFU|nr:uncharacterized protein CLAFUR5_09678 [Fulvia fulva]KAK4613601.1 hypothetical protein CLAFUR4_09589 [Fulvia fulva]KAK4614315.1 hypothetical protein CLAFUR0_09580 [Fulvia fulva]UJO21701.1 hypothetical protein CLAFUR5_09678 [Fulvia fulva]WPV19981.1 hypothetical protein CLAFUW4_09584 [Fulvia fulva]WPV35238.1 hypothetical protein CLAFUW7_09585 [Fulvia fulva]